MTATTGIPADDDPANQVGTQTVSCSCTRRNMDSNQLFALFVCSDIFYKMVKKEKRGALTELIKLRSSKAVYLSICLPT